MTAQVLAFPQPEKSRREVRLAKKRAYYAANRETILAKKRAKYAEDPEHVLGNQRASRRGRRMNMFLAREIAEGPAMLAELDAILRGLRPRLV